MLLIFWLIILAMIALALGFSLWPVFRRLRSRRGVDYSLAVVAIFMMIALPLFSLLLYSHWGSGGALARYFMLKRHAQAVTAEIKQFKSPRQVIEKMRRVLRDHPDSDEGWYLLGKLYNSVGDYQNAAAAFAKADTLKPDTEKYMLAYAEASFFADNKALSPTAENYIKQVLRKQPNNPQAINLQALNAYHIGDYQTAVNDWERLLPMFPPDTEAGKVLMKAIAEAQKRLQRNLDTSTLLKN